MTTKCMELQMNKVTHNKQCHLAIQEMQNYVEKLRMLCCKPMLIIKTLSSNLSQMKGTNGKVQK